MGQKGEAVGEAINLGSSMDHRVISLANMVGEEVVRLRAADGI
jgi:hypothetical protein